MCVLIFLLSKRFECELLTLGMRSREQIRLLVETNGVIRALHVNWWQWQSGRENTYKSLKDEAGTTSSKTE